MVTHLDLVQDQVGPGKATGALTAATYSTIAATPILGLLAVTERWYLGRPLTTVSLGWESLLAIGTLGVGSTAAAWYLWYKRLEYVPAGTVAAFFFLQPVVGTALAAVVLGERVGPAFVVGSLVIGVSVWVVSRGRASETEPRSSSDRRVRDRVRE